jgi:hypothetical protein
MFSINNNRMMLARYLRWMGHWKPSSTAEDQPSDEPLLVVASLLGMRAV